MFHCNCSFFFFGTEICVTLLISARQVLQSFASGSLVSCRYYKETSERACKLGFSEVALSACVLATFASSSPLVCGGSMLVLHDPLHFGASVVRDMIIFQQRKAPFPLMKH